LAQKSSKIFVEIFSR